MHPARLDVAVQNLRKGRRRTAQTERVPLHELVEFVRLDFGQAGGDAAFKPAEARVRSIFTLASCGSFSFAHPVCVADPAPFRDVSQPREEDRVPSFPCTPRYSLPGLPQQPTQDLALCRMNLPVGASFELLPALHEPYSVTNRTFKVKFALTLCEGLASVLAGAQALRRGE